MGLKIFIQLIFFKWKEIIMNFKFLRLANAVRRFLFLCFDCIRSAGPNADHLNKVDLIFTFSLKKKCAIYWSFLYFSTASIRTIYCYLFIMIQIICLDHFIKFLSCCFRLLFWNLRIHLFTFSIVRLLYLHKLK